jgi:hypothetical protein
LVKPLQETLESTVMLTTTLEGLERTLNEEQLEVLGRVLEVVQFEESVSAANKLVLLPENPLVAQS